MNGWVVFLLVAVPLLLLLAIVANSDSIINIPPGKVGLLLVSGKATDQVVQPGLHWVPRLRRRQVAEYPSLELSYRAIREGDPPAEGSDLDHTGPALRVTLGDRTRVTVGYTVRFRLDPARLRSVHERFGTEGFWNAVRDVSARAVRHRLGDTGVGVDDLFGTGLATLEEQVSQAVATSLDEDAVVLAMFAVGDVDLGRTGEVIQSTARARLELEREQAESSVRMARAKIDAELEPYLASLSDAALRYREVDVWRDLVHSQPDRWMQVPGRPTITLNNTEPAEPPASAEPAAEPADEA